MAPPNTSAATATVITSLPFSETIDVTDAPNGSDGRHAVWYKYTASAGELLVGLMAFADPAGTYRPQIDVYTGAPGALVAGFPDTSIQRPSTMPVGAGGDFYIKVTDSESTDPLTTSLQFSAVAPTLSTDPIPSGSIVINDDCPGYPGIIISAVDGTILTIIDVVSGEMGEGLPGTAYVFHDQLTGNIVLYNASFTVVKSITGITDTRPWCQIRALRPSTFFVGANLGSYTADAKISTISLAGDIGATQWTLTDDDARSIYLCALASNLDQTILYYSSHLVESPICKWDLVNNVKLADFKAGVVGYFLCRDLLVLADGSLIFGYVNNSDNYDCYILHCNSNGDVLNTYTVAKKLDRLCKGLDDPTSFWMWDFGTAVTREMRFTKIKVSDGSILTTFTVPEFEYGRGPLGYTSIASAARFGVSNSCPIMLTQTEFTGGTGGGGGDGGGTPTTDITGGIHYIHPDKSAKHDSYYPQVELPIPDPVFRTGFIGE
jgi:hypothetical protein